MNLTKSAFAFSAVRQQSASSIFTGDAWKVTTETATEWGAYGEQNGSRLPEIE